LCLVQIFQSLYQSVKVKVEVLNFASRIKFG